MHERWWKAPAERPCACLVSWQWDKVCVAVRPGRTSVFVYGTEALISSLYWRHSLPVSNLLHWFTPLCLSTLHSLYFFFSISYLIQLTPRSPAGPWNSLLPFPSSFSLSVSLLEIRCSLCTHWRKHWLAQMHAKSITVDGTRLSLVMQVYWWTQTLVIFISLCLCLYIFVSVFLSFSPPKRTRISAEIHSCMHFYLCYCNHLVLCATLKIIVLKWRGTR